jgi:hypothetical protein
MITLRQSGSSLTLYVHVASYCFGYATRIVLSKWADPLAYPFYVLTENVLFESVRLDPDHFFVPRALTENKIAWPLLLRHQVLEPVPGKVCQASGRQIFRLGAAIIPDTDQRQRDTDREALLRFWGDLQTPASAASRRIASVLHGASLSPDMNQTLLQVISSLDTPSTQSLYIRNALLFDQWMGQQGYTLRTIDRQGLIAYRRHIAPAQTKSRALGMWSVIRRCMQACQLLALRSDDPATAIRGMPDDGQKE